MSDSQFLLNLVSTLAIVGGLLFAGLQVRLAQKQRTRDSAIQLMQSFHTPEFVAGIVALLNLPEGLSKSELEERLGERMNDVLLLMLSFESIGILVQKREVSIELVEDFFTGPIILAWRKMNRYVEDVRKEMQMETPMEYFQFLSELVIRRQQAQPPVAAHIAYRDWKPR